MLRNKLLPILVIVAIFTSQCDNPSFDTIEPEVKNKPVNSDVIQTETADTLAIEPGKPAINKEKFGGMSGYFYDTEWYTTSTNYNIDKIKGRTVTGDFNGDGKDDVAAMYDYGSSSATIHVFLSKGITPYNQSGFTYQGNSGWWSVGSGNYSAPNVARRFVSGDFNGDGKDDIASIYNYGSGTGAIHVWLSTGTSFWYQGNNGWRTLSQYDVTKLNGRVIAGDFNGDGKDDIAGFYDYGSNTGAIHVFLSTGSYFAYQGNDGWRTLSQYNVNKLTDRLVSDDFNGDGKDDIAGIYDYGSTDKIHVFLSTGTYFSYQGNNGWYTLPSSGNNNNAFQIVAGQFNADIDSKADIAYFKRPEGYVTVSEMTYAPFNQWPLNYMKGTMRSSSGSNFNSFLSGVTIGSSYVPIPPSYDFLMGEFFHNDKQIILTGNFDGDANNSSEIYSFSEVQTFYYLYPDTYIPRVASSFLTTDIKVNN